MPNFAAILLAAGKSSRFRDKEKKPFADLEGRAVWLRSLELFSLREDYKQIVVVIAPEDKELFDRRYRANMAFVNNPTVVDGGEQRSDSVRNALAAVAADIEFVAIHDTARPCLTAEMLEKVTKKGAETGAAILACPVVDTLKRRDQAGNIQETVGRDYLFQAQTPQVFRRTKLIEAYAKLPKGDPVTDDAQLIERVGQKVAIVENDASNIKITSKQDIFLAAAILKSRVQPKAKQSFHPFAEDDMWR